MSKTQPTLDDYYTPDQDSVESEQEGGAEEPEVVEGALYGRPSETASRDEPDDAGCCRNCGRDLLDDSTIAKDVLRVVGDNHLRTPVCDDLECRLDVFGGGEIETDAHLSRTVGRYRVEEGSRQ